jgi:hypothetical protein
MEVAMSSGSSMPEAMEVMALNMPGSQKQTRPTTRTWIG